MPIGDESSRFGVVMCLEDTYPDLARAYAQDGARLLVAMVNTESFRETGQGLAHLRRARLTAVAAGLPVIRAANSGVSCSIDSHGRILDKLEPNVRAVRQFPVSSPTGTVYNRIGDEGVITGVLLLLGLEWLALREPVMRIALAMKPKRRRRRMAAVRHTL
jgi:apolipoprotein N-acyltransferase